MKRFLAALTAIMIGAGGQISAEAAERPAAPTFGRFIGVLRHPGIRRDQLAKLDFIPSREVNNVIQLKAVLTLHFGDYRSAEYVAYHFDDVRFNLLTNTFVFDQPDQPISFVTKRFSGGELSGEFRSGHSGDLGQVILRSDSNPVVPQFDLLEPIWGEYRGLCHSKTSTVPVETVFQLYTYRSSEGASQVGNPFRPYKIKGLIGEKTGKGDCLNNEMCVWGNVQSGAYNYFKNRLTLFTTLRNFECKTEKDGLSCKGCTTLLKRSSTETGGNPRAMSPVAFQPDPAPGGGAAPSLKDDSNAIQGEYKGYVYHEYLGQYQSGSLNLVTYQAPATAGEAPTLRLSAIASLHFGSDDDAETIAYRFDERSYPSPLSAPQFVLSQANADVDAILQVTFLGKGVVKGIWFSRLFGRVGRFEFSRTAMPPLPPGAEVMGPLSGHYESNDWEIDLLVGSGAAAPGTENPFAPLTIGGIAILPSLIPKVHLSGGSYDFYTGKIGLEAGEDRVHVGFRPSNKRMYLKSLRRMVLSPMPAHPLLPYRLLVEDR